MNPLVWYNSLVLHVSSYWYISIGIWVVICLLTIVQKYHYIMLHELSDRVPRALWKVMKWIIRITVIIHEFSHLLWWVLTWAKPTSMELFRADGGRVGFSRPNYMAHADLAFQSPLFALKLIWHTVWWFLTSLWPLITGILSTISLLWLVWWIPWW